MFLSIFVLIFLSTGNTSASGLPRCPYPLAEFIEPCICELDENYRMILSCLFEDDFAEESFNRVVDAFDYNNHIYSFTIDLYQYNYNYIFYPQLNAANLGKLNITNFSLKNAKISDNLFGEGLFDGSTGSIQNITLERIQTASQTDGSINLGSHVLHPACPTLQSLKLERVVQLSSTSLIHSPNLEVVSLTNSMFPIIPSSLFTPENVPGVRSIAIGVQEDLSLQTDAFRDLSSLTSLEIYATNIDIIQSYSLSNLPRLESLQLSNINIVRIEEDAFEDLTSLKALVITGSDIEELPRIFSNSPSLTDFSLTNSKLLNIDEKAFSGVPSLENLILNGNTKLRKLNLSNFKNLTTINLLNNKLTDVSLDNLPRLPTLTINSKNNEALSVNISNCQNLIRLDLENSNLLSLDLLNVEALKSLDLEYNTNLNHTGLGSSLYSIIQPEAQIRLRRTNVRSLDEFLFRPLLETFTSAESSTGYFEMYEVPLDCGCDVKWIIEEFDIQKRFFSNAKCVDGSSLYNVDPNLLDMMCPP